jgi:aerobic-type carbon monoxide dehydrogenase small subunit (CoxS/CutS family)
MVDRAWKKLSTTISSKSRNMTTITHNHHTCTLAAAPSAFLLHVLREECSDASVRFGCGSEHCGACTVLVDGQAENACTLPVWAAEGRHVQTAQGLPEDPIGRLILQAFIDEQAAQCGYCSSGILMRITGLLKRQPDADEDLIRETLSRHLCRCGAHVRILRAVRLAQKSLSHDSAIT